MNLLIATSRFHPLVGGTAVVASRLAKALFQAGHRVTVMTKTPAGESVDDSLDFKVIRKSSTRKSFDEIQKSDGVIMIEMSLKWWSLCQLARKRHLVTHHTHPYLHGRKISAELRLQRFLGSFSSATACSRMIAKEWGKDVTVLPNPYDASIFKIHGGPRTIDFAFAGRLIEEKGLLIFLAALAEAQELGN